MGARGICPPPPPVNPANVTMGNNLIQVTDITTLSKHKVMFRSIEYQLISIRMQVSDCILHKSNSANLQA